MFLLEIVPNLSMILKGKNMKKSWKLHIKAIGFDTDSGAIDKTSNKALKEIATLVCKGQLPGHDLPSNSEIALRQQYILKQLSVGFIKWRSKTFNDSLKLFTCD